MIDKEILYKKAWEKWGDKLQFLMVMEECAELQKECSKQIRGKGTVNGLAEEIADVEIMIEQIKHVFLCDSPYIDEIKKKKLERLNTILQ